MSVCSDHQSSRYFTSAGQQGSLSPSAFLPSRSRPRADDLKAPSPLLASSFMPASTLLQNTPSKQHAAGLKHLSPNVVTIGTPSSRVSSNAATPSSHKQPVRRSGTAKARSRPGKALAKSEEFVLDSDESGTEALARVGYTSSRSLDVPIEISVEPRDGLFRPAARMSTVRKSAASPASAENAMALTRRRSWTPLRDTNDDGTGSDAALAMRSQHFSKLVIDYHYDDGSARTPQAPDVELLDKQGKVAKARVANPLKDRSVKEKVPKVEKIRPVKEKVPKVQRVRPVKEKLPKVQKIKAPKKKAMTITALATAPYQPVGTSISDQITIPEALAIVRPPESEESTVKAATVTKRKAKTAVPGATKKPAKKAKVAGNTVPRLLLSPSQAQGCLAHQTFVFGTSSQLHAEESTETLKDIQLALQASELSPHSVQAFSSPDRKSRITVPSAPHGTCLSLEQATRDLWCVSARDHAGSVLLDDGSDESRERPVEVIHAASVDGAPVRPVLDTTSKDNGQPPCDSALPTVSEQQGQDDTNDEFVMISSDSPQPVSDGPADHVDQPAAATPPLVQTSPACLRPPWPSSQRAVLQPLDANRNLKIASRKTSPTFKTSRGASAPQQTTLARTSPKRRGRPHKASLQHELIEITSSSPLALLGKNQSPVKTTSPSKILATLHSSPPSEWHNIDEISDADVPPTPSPPRTRQSHSPRPEPALTLAFEQIAGDDTPEFANQDSKDPGYWLSASKKLFPQITSAVRAAPRSESLTHPTWHEKILLYDPIVIEDLTAWLNAQGLRVTVSKRKPKSRGKKKDAGATEALNEQIEEELAHWMVQKWCEEHSICCLWKEGLRGGVRTRY